MYAYEDYSPVGRVMTGANPIVPLSWGADPSFRMQAAMARHVERKDNPHSVTAEQIRIISEDLLKDYSKVGHVHEQYLTEHQSLEGYSRVGHVHEQYLTEHQSLAGYALVDHNHMGVYQPAGSYAAANHNHTGVYQPAGSYAAADHNHAGTYQPVGNYLTEHQSLKPLTDRLDTLEANYADAVGLTEEILNGKQA